jgi:hypothetical protein
MFAKEQYEGQARYEAAVVEEALDAAVAVIQKYAGEESGDFAGMWFAGATGDQIREILTVYKRAQDQQTKYLALQEVSE